MCGFNIKHYLPLLSFFADSNTLLFTYTSQFLEALRIFCTTPKNAMIKCDQSEQEETFSQVQNVETEDATEM
jgi:hypothetical protein